MERTIDYLSATMSAASFYAVELVRFAADGISAFESRTILRPESHKPGSKRAVATNEPASWNKLKTIPTAKHFRSCWKSVTDWGCSFPGVRQVRLFGYRLQY